MVSFRCREDDLEPIYMGVVEKIGYDARLRVSAQSHGK